MPKTPDWTKLFASLELSVSLKMPVKLKVLAAPLLPLLVVLNI